MLKAFVLLVLLLASSARAVLIEPNQLVPQLQTVTFAQLLTVANGTHYYCSDCAQTSTCAGAGTGAFALRINGAWSCAAGVAAAAFNGITGGTNTTATMHVGAGATLDSTGGLLQASDLVCTSCVNLATEVTGLLPLANLTDNDTTAGLCLVSGGAGGPPSYTTCPGGSTGFTSITSGINSSATMTVNTGAAINHSGSGTIDATSICTDCVNGTNISITGEAVGTVMTFDGTNWVVVPAGINGQFLGGTTGSTPTFRTVSFANISGSTNITAGMLVGSGASLGTTAGGTIQATSLTRTLNGGAGIVVDAGNGDLTADRTIATASTEASFLNNGAATNLTCASLQGAGSTQVMSNGTLQYCDGGATLRRAAIGDATGNAANANQFTNDPGDCGANQYATTIAQNGNLTCATVGFNQLGGGTNTTSGAMLIGTGSSLATTAGGTNQATSLTRTLTGGAGIAAVGDLTADRTIATASQEASFVANGAATDLTCGGAQGAGSFQVMNNGTVEYCDGNSTLQRAAIGDATGKLTLAKLTDNDTTANLPLLSGGAGGDPNYAELPWTSITSYPTACSAGSFVQTLADVPTCASNASTATALAANPINCTAGGTAGGFAPAGIDAGGVVEGCITVPPSAATYITQTPDATLSAEQALSALGTGIMQSTTGTGVVSTFNNSAGLINAINDETGTGSLVFGTAPAISSPVITGTISGTHTEAGAVTFNVGSLLDKGEICADPTAYGTMDPTGVTDARAAIQAAIDAVPFPAGGKVCIPAGTFLVTSPGLRIRRGITLVGAGAGAATSGATTLKSSTGAAGTGYSVIQSSSPRMCVAGAGACDGAPNSASRGAGCICYTSQDCTSGQCGNSGCTGSGVPNACCSGINAGTCNNTACTGLNTPQQCCSAAGAGTCAVVQTGPRVQDLSITLNGTNQVGIDATLIGSGLYENVFFTGNGATSIGQTGMLVGDDNATVSGYTNKIFASTFSQLDIGIRLMPTGNDTRIFHNFFATNLTPIVIERPRKCNAGTRNTIECTTDDTNTVTGCPGATCPNCCVIAANTNTARIQNNRIESGPCSTCGSAAPTCTGNACVGGYYNGRACNTASDCLEAGIIDMGSATTIKDNRFENVAPDVRLGDPTGYCTTAAGTRQDLICSTDTTDAITGCPGATCPFCCLNPTRFADQTTIVDNQTDNSPNDIALNNARSYKAANNTSLFNDVSVGLSSNAVNNLVSDGSMEGWIGTSDLLGWTSFVGGTLTNWDNTGAETRDSVLRDTKFGNFSAKVGVASVQAGIASPQIPVDATKPYTLTFLWGSAASTANGKMRWAFRLFDASNTVIPGGLICGTSQTGGAAIGVSCMSYTATFNAHISGNDVTATAPDVLQRQTYIANFPPNTASVRVGIFVNSGVATSEFISVDDVYFGEGQANLRPIGRMITDAGDQTINGGLTTTGAVVHNGAAVGQVPVTVNAITGQTSDLLDLQVNGVNRFQITSTGSSIATDQNAFNLGNVLQVKKNESGTATLTCAAQGAVGSFSAFDALGTGLASLRFCNDAADGVNFTGVQLDAEGTSNTLTVPEKVWLPAAGCNNATASSFWDLPTTTPAAAACVTGTNIQKGVLDYADTTGGFSAQTTIALPADWTTATLPDINLYWTTTATTGNAKWTVQFVCTDVAATATDDPAFPASGSGFNTVTTAAPGTASRVQTSNIVAATVPASCVTATKELLHIRVFRDGNDAADTITATARLIGMELTARRAM